MIKVIWTLAFVLLALGSQAQVEIIGGDGITLSDLKNSDVLVTVVLKGSMARDANLKIVDMGKDYVAVMPPNGARTAYRFADIHQIRIQEKRIRSYSAKITSSGGLSLEDQTVAERATKRAFEIFKKTKNNQSMRMEAASIMLTGGMMDAKIYLQQLVGGNDIPTAVEASMYLYIAGETPDTETVLQGIVGGNRKARALSAKLAGLSGNAIFTQHIAKLLRDPSADVFPGAAFATARIGDRSGIPILLNTIKALQEAKAEAAVEALSYLGGEDVRQEMLKRLKTTRGMEWFRAVKVLFALGDAEGKRILQEDCLGSPVFGPEASLLLGASGDWDASVRLRAFLENNIDPNAESLAYRARVAATLYKGGYAQAQLVLRQLLRTTPDQIFARGKENDTRYKKQTAVSTQVIVCELIGRSGERRLLSLVQSAIESSNSRVALAACSAALAIADPEYNGRLQDFTS